MTKLKKRKSITKSMAIEMIKDQGGTIRTTKAIKMGIHPVTLYKLYETGHLEKISRGVYRLTELEAISNPDFVMIAARVPHAVICLISALSYHNLTSQIPHKVSIAIKRDSRKPTIEFPPISVHRFSPASYQAGIEETIIDGVLVRIYNPEKTIADCFKFRNEIGMDVVLEAIKLYKTRKSFKLDEILKYAGICRVEKVIKPYLEIIL
ncbi:MAG: type IV toxin-antitoxin system AbiEi family antitoxin domain-containing protein [Candidatus Aminicenantes bacterium]|nr:type IV toxin-antitoxin system AbiEi family antitoxin domain-containing protein [Candidatus Aminicenantes bacterium]